MTLLAFWFPTCGSCRVELPQLEPIYQKYKENGLEIVAIDVYGDRAGGEKFVSDKSLSYRFLDGNLQIAESYGVSSTPTMFIIDRNGTIVERINRVDNRLENQIRELLELE